MSYQSIASFFSNHFVESCAIVFLLICVAARIFNEISGFKRLKKEREELQTAKDAFETYKLSIQSDRKKLDDDAASRLRTQQAQYAANEKRLAQQEAAMRQSLVHIRSSLRKTLLDDLRAFPAFASLSEDDKQLTSAITSDMWIFPPFEFSACVSSGSGKTYHTSLRGCDCEDFKFRKRPCKHMIRLGISLGLLLNYDTDAQRIELSHIMTQKNEHQAALAKKEKFITAKEEHLRHLEKTQDQTYPWLAELRADAYETADTQWIDYLQNKSRPAMQKATEVSSIIHGELRQARIAAKQAEYQVHFYESLFPWLLDYKELPPAEAFSYVQDDSSSPPEEDVAVANKYLSPQERAELSDAERYQLILDRYIARGKTNWEIGIEYERYIGYLCEQRGYSVTYNGARAKLEDMGRDLILRRGNDVILVQCKRWASEKVIRENHVFQLAGSVFEYQYQHPQQSVSGVMVTSTTLSEVAQRCAGYLGIQVFSGVPFQEYQFAHELCHFVIHQPVCAHYRWLEETLCELMSWCVLSWIYANRVSAPLSTMNGIYDSIPRYISNSRQDRLDLGGFPLHLFVAKNLPHLRSDCYDRRLNRSIANELFPLFLAHPELWQIVFRLPYLSNTVSLYTALHFICDMSGTSKDLRNDLVRLLVGQA